MKGENFLNYETGESDLGGMSTVDISRGFKKLKDDIPNSGENIFNPRHVADDKRVAAMAREFEWPDEHEEDHGPDGFLERDLPDPYQRPFRSSKEDRG